MIFISLWSSRISGHHFKISGGKILYVPPEMSNFKRSRIFQRELVYGKPQKLPSNDLECHYQCQLRSVGNYGSNKARRLWVDPDYTN